MPRRRARTPPPRRAAPSRSAITTCAPRPANSRAHASPMPLAPPVTSGASARQILVRHPSSPSSRGASALSMKRIMSSKIAGGSSAGGRAVGIPLPQQEPHADQLAHAHERPRRDAGIERRVDVADRLRRPQPRLVALDDARVVQAQRLGRDELGLAHDAVERGVLGREPEEAGESGALGLEARRGARHRLRHRVANATVEVDHERLEDRPACRRSTGRTCRGRRRRAR